MSKPEPKAQQNLHPEIVGVAMFRTKDGWRCGTIRTRDPGIIAKGTLTEPNLKSITVAAMKTKLARVWSAE